MKEVSFLGELSL